MCAPGRIVLPLVALVIAILAVPFVLGGGEESPETALAPAATEDPSATRVESAVLAEQTGIRNYERRLEALRKKNPFEQQFASTPEDQIAVDEPAAAPDPSIAVETDPPLTSTDPAGASTDSTGVSTAPATPVAEPATPVAPSQQPLPVGPHTDVPR